MLMATEHGNRSDANNSKFIPRRSSRLSSGRISKTKPDSLAKSHTSKTLKQGGESVILKFTRDSTARSLLDSDDVCHAKKCERNQYCKSNSKNTGTGDSFTKIRDTGLAKDGSPDGKKIRSKPQLEKVLGDDFDLSNFEFRSGTFTRRSKRRANQNGSNELLYSRDFGSNVLPHPERQSTKSFAKQPVTYFTPRSENDPKRPKTDSNTRVEKDKPTQIFWQKRLQNLQVTDGKDDIVIGDFTLPDGIKKVGPGIDSKSLIHSIVTTLQQKGSVKGQNMSLVALEKHPEVWLNAEQPPCAPFVISETDIKKQEEKVQKLRRRLAEALVDYENLKRLIVQQS